jgi:EAL and modified HD-GYP domain-containing signal transduction protein
MERVLVSRQPIYREDMAELGYELLFRNSEKDQASFSDGDQATAEVIINTFMDIGLDAMVGPRMAFINFDRNLILGNYCDCLPRDRVVLELLERGTPDTPLIRKLQALRTAGYTIALDDFSVKESSKPLLEVATFVKVDIAANDWAAVEHSLAVARKHSAQLIAKKVETREQFNTCKVLGFNYFQGYFFCRPQLVEGRRLPVNRLATVRLITKLNNPSVSLKELEQAIGQDVSLTYKLLRYINSAAQSLSKPVSSIGHAIMLVGQQQIRTWASLILFSKFDDKPRDVVVTGAIRAKMCEYLSPAVGLANPDRSFLVGLLSVLDAVVNQPLEQIVPSLPLDDEIAEALLGCKGKLGGVLRCVLEYEKRNWREAQAAVNLSDDVIRDAYRKSVGWSLSTLNGFSEPAIQAVS